MNGAPGLLAETSVLLGMSQEEVALLKEFKLVAGESQKPGDVNWSNGKGVFVCWNEGHIIVVK